MSGNILKPDDYGKSGDLFHISFKENNEVVVCRKENDTDDRWDRIIILNTEKVIV